MEPLAKGGTASGPVSFMRGADSWAGTIKSGGKTRRAAKMVVLDVDHPDIREFIWCKAKEEDKAAALRDAGFDMSIDGDGFHSIQYQNANNSVRVTDEFMHAVENDEDWHLIARTTGEPVGEPIHARELMREIAEAAWRCADPGVQYDTTINQWHTSPNSGRINASNPCSEYMHVDDSACNLASLNLMKFRRAGRLVRRRVASSTRSTSCCSRRRSSSAPSSYPTEEIGEQRARVPPARPRLREPRRVPDGQRLRLRLRRGSRRGGGDHGADDRPRVRAVGQDRRGDRPVRPLRGEPRGAQQRHADAPRRVVRVPDGAVVDTPLLAAARETWNEAVALGERYGYRNAQATVLAPTGTISFLMDCDTTGIEPDFSLVKYKELVGGGTMTIVNRTVPMALRTLGYGDAQIEQIEAYVDEHGTIVGAPGLERRAPAGVRRRGRRARDLARRPHQDDGRGPAVPLGRDLQDGQHAADRDGRGHRRGLHPGLAARRQGAGDLPRRLEDRAGAAHRRAGDQGAHGQGRGRDRGGRGDLHPVRGRGADRRRRSRRPSPRAKAREDEPLRKRMPRERQSLTHKFSLGGHEGYITAGMYEDGTVGEIFLTDIGKEGSTLRGMMNSFATAISISLQYGVPLETLVRKFAYMRFEPEGITTNPEIPFAKSMPDYIMRWLASRFLDADTQEELGILTPEVRAKKIGRGHRVRRLRRLVRARPTAATAAPRRAAPQPRPRPPR